LWLSAQATELAAQSMIFVVNFGSSIIKGHSPLDQHMAQNKAHRKDFTIAARLCANWDIIDVTHSLPVQLRPRGGGQVEPTIIALLFELSKTSRGEVDQVQCC
jgi:hypothetical protein